MRRPGGLWRWRHASIAVALLACVAVLGAALQSEPDSQAIVVETFGDEPIPWPVGRAAPATSTTTSPGDPSSAAAPASPSTGAARSGPVEALDQPGPSAPVTIAPEPPDVTTTTIPCLNDFDARCGPLRWTSPPARNGAVTVVVTTEPAQPIAGEPFVITMVATDPDATPVNIWFYAHPDSEPPSPVFDAEIVCDTTYTADQGYGPWDPPMPRGGSLSSSRSYTFDEPGTYRVDGCSRTYSWEDVDMSSSRLCPGDPDLVSVHPDPANGVPGSYLCWDPYMSVGEAHVVIEVVAP